MALTESQQKAIALSLACRVPFAVYSMPGCDDAVFIADNQSDECANAGGVTDGVKRRFGIYSWLSSDGYYIYDNLSADDVINVYGDATKNGLSTYIAEPLAVSTPRQLYLERVESLIGRLKSRGGKTVYSRVLCGDFSATSGPLSAITRLFDNYTSTFNAVYFHPAVGAWMLSSPELLLSVDRLSGRYETMSLAGTRPVADDGLPWDDKNVNEQHIVTDYICDTLTGLGLTCVTSPLETITSGAVQHLRNIISGYAVDSPISVACALSPTPALGGYPKADSLSDIDELELQPRRCYGGFVTAESDDEFKAYVNLRCCQFDMRRYALYAGGGITPQSHPEAEWRETESKLLRLRSLID